MSKKRHKWKFAHLFICFYNIYNFLQYLWYLPLNCWIIQIESLSTFEIDKNHRLSNQNLYHEKVISIYREFLIDIFLTFKRIFYILS